MNRNRKSVDFAAKNNFFVETCRKQGLKITPQRIAIYQELTASTNHPSAIMIFRKIRNHYPTISLATVNSTLVSFARIGLAKVVEAPGGPKRFDPKLEQHHHFHCLRCGKIVDFDYADYDALRIPVTLSRKFVVVGKTVHLEGICDLCQSRKKVNHNL